MKQPDEAAIGGARKSLPTRKSRKVPKTAAKPTAAPSSAKKPARKKNILDKDVERELVKVFGEK